MLACHQGSRLFGSSPEAPDRRNCCGMDQPQPENNLEMIKGGDMVRLSTAVFQKILNSMGFKSITNGGTYSIHVLI